MTVATAGNATEAVAAMAAVPVRTSVAARMLQFFGSMRLAVWLLALLALLTWLGTLAQVKASTYAVQREYFESWFVIAELPLSWWGKPIVRGEDSLAFNLRIPLPGACPLLALLFVNLLVGGLLRLRRSWRNLGILVGHVGIALLLLAGFVKLIASYSGSLTLFENPSDGNRAPGRPYEAGQFVSFHEFELALLKDNGSTIEERVVPESALWPARGNGSVTVRGAGLPFSVQVHHWIDHARPMPKGPAVSPLTPVVDGVYLNEEKWPPGVQPRSEHEFAGCYVTIFVDGGERIEAVLWGVPKLPADENRYPFTFTVQGQRYGLDLRHVVYELPFRLRLDKFQKLDHPGTMSPRDFRSFVSVQSGGQSREAQVFMNNPLRQDGFVVYQTGWGPQPMGGPPWYTVFEIAHNPSDIWPMLACFVIAAGFLIHFIAKLHRFLQSSARTSLLSGG